MTCNFLSFSTVFQSYQNVGRVLLNSCVQENPLKNNVHPPVGLKWGLLYQQASIQPTELRAPHSITKE